ncbi:MAG: DUF2855 family protein [Gammaproteobacteria bacterium]|nr:DUF2855 family protein [Gammaproteobacteria bacterium]
MSNEFQIRRDDFETCRVLEADSDADTTKAGDGEIRVRVERFAFTANNISYAATGDQLGYWQFFPPTDVEGDGWGMMPVWGFAEVVESNVDEVPVGDRLFGYFPPASHLNLTPMHIGPLRFVDGAEHRAQLPQGYNTYYRVKAEPGYDPANDDLRMLLWPLHITSFFLWDFLQDADWFGAAQVIIVSASSKTSIGLAYALDDDTKAPPAVAVTSARNLDFVKSLGLYAQSVSYDALMDIDATIPAVIVDMSGNGEVLGKLHTHLGDNMQRCINVGLTHWDEGLSAEGINKERSEFFFAPAHIQRRMQDWGPDGFAQKTSSFMQETALKSRAWLELKRIDGLQGLAEVYSDVCHGRLSPAQGFIVEL